MSEKIARLELRIDKNLKMILQRAADILDISLSDFVINAAYTNAFTFINSHENILNTIKQQALIINELKKDIDE